MGDLPKITKSDKSRYKPDEKPTYNLRCTCCGKTWKKPTEFLSSPYSPLYKGNGGKIPICRMCLDRMYCEYRKTLSEEDAVRRICMKFDLYFNPGIVEATKTLNERWTRMAQYAHLANIAGNYGKTYDTTIEEEARQQALLDEARKKGEVDEFHVTKEVISSWGVGFTDDEYALLENELVNWKTKCIVDGHSKETLVRQLCVLQIQMNRALLEGKYDLYQKLIDTFQKTLDRAELSPKVESANDKAAEKPMGVMIKMFEEEEPIPDTWKDSNPLIKLISIYFMGHLCKMVGIKNKYSNMYEEEMAKYRVEVPELSDADDEDIFDYIISHTEGGGEDE